MKVFRKVADPARYMAVGHDSRPLTGGTVNTFPASIPVKPGDLLGSGGSDPNSACVYSTPSADVWLSRPNNLADGESGDFTFGSTARVNVSAVFVYSNSFNLGKVDRNKRKGTATLPVDVPNPGVLALSAAGVRSEQASAAAGGTGNAFPAAGTVNLLIKPKGKNAGR